jgi:hypothetical protein
MARTLLEKGGGSSEQFMKSGEIYTQAAKLLKL